MSLMHLSFLDLERNASLRSATSGTSLTTLKIGKLRLGNMSKLASIAIIRLSKINSSTQLIGLKNGDALDHSVLELACLSINNT